MGKIILLLVFIAVIYNYYKAIKSRQNTGLKEADFLQTLDKDNIDLILSRGNMLIDDEHSSKLQLEEVYRVYLSQLKNHPKIKPDCLVAGRRAYGVLRQDGNPTVYDEQAIANDILAHS